MTRALGPTVGIGRQAALPLGILDLCWLPVELRGIVWLAGGVTSWATGPGWRAPPFSLDSAQRLINDGPAGLWPGIFPVVVWAVVGALLLLVAVPLAIVARTVDGARSMPGDPLDPASFIRTEQSHYLLSKDGAGAAAPLVAALADRVMRDAVRAAERDGGRMDPTMIVVLDEAADVCRIADLPELHGHLGSRGVLPVTILQSYRQGTRVWGDHGMDALWSAATCKLLGAGLDDARLVEDVSRLVGDHDVPVRSISRGDGRATESVSLRRQRVLPPEDIRALPKGSALLLATGCRPAMVSLQPWYSGERAHTVAAPVRSVTFENARCADDG